MFNAGIDVGNEQLHEQWIQNQCKLKEQTAAAAKGRKPEHKPEHKSSTHNKQEAPKVASIQKKKSKPVTGIDTII